MSHDPRRINLIVVHHQAANPKNATQGKWGFEAWRDVQRSHLARFKMKSGYHEIVERDGFVMGGTRIQKRGAHAPPNSNRYGILLTGWNEDPDKPSREAVDAGWDVTWSWTDAQWESLIHTLEYRIHYLPEAYICGHNQTKPTLCPGLDLRRGLSDHGFRHMGRVVKGRLY